MLPGFGPLNPPPLGYPPYPDNKYLISDDMKSALCSTSEFGKLIMY